MTNWGRSICFALLMLLVTACHLTRGSNDPSFTSQPSPMVTADVTLTPFSARPATPANAATAFPGDRDEALIPLPGIVFENGEGTWLIEADSGERLLTTHRDVEVSPDGGQGLVIVDGDVLLLNFETGEEVNLTLGRGRVHSSAAWWPARPGALILTSAGPDEAGAGRLTLVEVEGSDYRVVQDGAVAHTFPAAAPDGETIAFDAGRQGMLYRMDGGSEPFDPRLYGLAQGIDVVSMGSPAWSPDGRRLAWVVGVRDGEGELRSALGVFDLGARFATLVHPYRPIGPEAWPIPPVWSTDGRWLAFSAQTLDPAERGLWVANPEGTVERRLRAIYHPVVWSPRGEEHWTNGNTLVIARPHWNTEGDNWLAVSGGWQETALVLPGAVVDWLPWSSVTATDTLPPADSAALSTPPATAPPVIVTEPTPSPSPPPSSANVSGLPEIVSFSAEAVDDGVLLAWEAVRAQLGWATAPE